MCVQDAGEWVWELRRQVKEEKEMSKDKPVLGEKIRRIIIVFIFTLKQTNNKLKWLSSQLWPIGIGMMC